MPARVLVRAPSCLSGTALRGCAIAALGWTMPLAAQTSSTPGDWLGRMDSAFRQLHYDGVFSHYTLESAEHTQGSAAGPGGTARWSHSRAGVRSSTFRVVHMIVDGVERERIAYLSGPQREILRSGEQVTCLLRPGDRLLNLEGALPSGLYGRVFARDSVEVGRYYEVSFNTPGRVAGRPVVALDVTPRDENRFGYKLWLDEQTGLLLRSELRDPAGAKLEIFEFKTVRFGDAVAAEDLRPQMEGALIRHLSRSADADADAAGADAEVVPAPWRPRWVPPGFRMTGSDMFQPDGRSAGVNTLRFSDGLAAFSVFIEPMPAAGAGSLVSRAGATLALTHLTRSAHGDQLITVVGEVPVATARRIARGVEHKDESAGPGDAPGLAR